MFMNRSSRKNFRVLKSNIDLYAVNEEILEKLYILLMDLNKVEYNGTIKLPIHNKVKDIINFECYSKVLDKKVVFNFEKGNKNFYVKVKYPDFNECIEVYNCNKELIITKNKNTNNTQTYLSVSVYSNNKLVSITEVMNMDFDDPALKKITEIKLRGNKGSKRETITYDKEPITDYYYNIDYLDSDLSYNNVKNIKNKYGYSQSLVYFKEYVDCKDELNKKVLTRK